MHRPTHISTKQYMNTYSKSPPPMQSCTPRSNGANHMAMEPWLFYSLALVVETLSDSHCHSHNVLTQRSTSTHSIPYCAVLKSNDLYALAVWSRYDYVAHRWLRTVDTVSATRHFGCLALNVTVWLAETSHATPVGRTGFLAHRQLVEHKSPHITVTRSTHSDRVLVANAVPTTYGNWPDYASVMRSHNLVYLAVAQFNDVTERRW